MVQAGLFFLDVFLQYYGALRRQCRLGFTNGQYVLHNFSSFLLGELRVGVHSHLAPHAAATRDDLVGQPRQCARVSAVLVGDIGKGRADRLLVDLVASLAIAFLQKFFPQIHVFRRLLVADERRLIGELRNEVELDFDALRVDDLVFGVFHLDIVRKQLVVKIKRAVVGCLDRELRQGVAHSHQQRVDTAGARRIGDAQNDGKGAVFRKTESDGPAVGGNGVVAELPAVGKRVFIQIVAFTGVESDFQRGVPQRIRGGNNRHRGTVARVVVDSHQPGIGIVDAIDRAVFQRVKRAVGAEGHVDGPPEIARGGHELGHAPVVLVVVQIHGKNPVAHPLGNEKFFVEISGEFRVGLRRRIEMIDRADDGAATACTQFGKLRRFVVGVPNQRLLRRRQVF